MLGLYVYIPATHPQTSLLEPFLLRFILNVLLKKPKKTQTKIISEWLFMLVEFCAFLFGSTFLWKLCTHLCYSQTIMEKLHVKFFNWHCNTVCSIICIHIVIILWIWMRSMYYNKYTDRMDRNSFSPVAYEYIFKF